MEMILLHSMRYPNQLFREMYTNLSVTLWYCRKRKKANATTANALRVDINP